MNYKIITDQKELENFIDWLPELEKDETFYCCLFARSKYTKHLDQKISHVKSDKAQLKRFTSNKKRLFDKIKQLECTLGSYKQKDTIIPQEALALYITINPRSFEKATKNSIKKLLELALQPYQGYNPYQEVMSEIQKAKSKTRFVSFDFDLEYKGIIKDIEFAINEFLNEEALTIVETRGGFHVIIDINKIHESFNKIWYNKMALLLSKYSSDTDNKGDIMLPVPGTYQGGFTPKMLK